MTDWISPTAEWPLSQGFRPPGNPGHEGVDIAVWVGTLIVAPHDGTVITAGLTDPYGYGNLIIVDHGDGFYTRYGHMSELWCGYGWVAQGQPLGLSGGARGAYGAGNSGGPHLHYEVRPGDVPIDPVPFLHPWGAPAPAPPPDAAPTPIPQPKEDEMITAVELKNGQVAVFAFGGNSNIYGGRFDVDKLPENKYGELATGVFRTPPTA